MRTKTNLKNSVSLVYISKSRMPLLYIQIGITFVLTYKRHSQSYSLFHVPKKSSFFNKCLHVSMVNRQNSSKIPRTF